MPFNKLCGFVITRFSLGVTALAYVAILAMSVYLILTSSFNPDWSEVIKMLVIIPIGAAIHGFFIAVFIYLGGLIQAAIFSKRMHKIEHGSGTEE